MSPESHQPQTPERENVGILAVAIGASALITPVIAFGLVAMDRLDIKSDVPAKVSNHVRHAGRRVVAGALGTKEAIADLRDVSWPAHPLRRLGNMVHNLADRFEEK